MTRAVDHVGQVTAFRIILALVLVTEYWCRAVPKWAELSSYYLVSVVLVTGLGVAALSRWHRAAFATLAAIHLGVVWNEFPATGNHGYLELYLCSLLAFLNGDDPGEAELLRNSVRWLATIVFFYSGLQKLVHGYYFDGTMLTYSLSTNSFRTVLQQLMPANELARLSRLSGQLGEGPYTSDSLRLVIASNAVWMTELALPALLWLRRTMTPALLLALLMIIVIEIAAREVFFGLVFTNALLMFASHRWQQRAVPVAGLICLTLLASRIGALPDAVFY